MKIDVIAMLKLANDLASIASAAHALGIDHPPPVSVLVAAVPSLASDLADKNFDKFKADLLALTVTPKV